MGNEGFILTQHSFNDGDNAIIHLWLSTANGPVRLIIDRERPLFFIHSTDNDLASKSLHSLLDHIEIKPLSLKTFDQQPVCAVYIDNLKHCRKAQILLRQSGIVCFENDIQLSHRLLMERFIYGSLVFTGSSRELQGYIEYRQTKVKPSSYKPQLRTLSLDIECAQDGQLYSIGFYSRDVSPYFQCVIMIGEPETGTDYIRWVNNEQQLLYGLIDTIKAVDPDIITGWNVINFDFKLLIERATRHAISLRLGRDNSAATWRTSRIDSQQGFVSIAGRVVIDGVHALRSATYHFPSFSLEHVAQTLLGRGKKTDDIDHRLEAIEHDFKHNKQKLAAYNLEDCVLVADIFEQTKVLDFLILRSQLTGLSLDKQGGSVESFTNLYLPLLHRAGYIAPNLPKDGGLASPGGYVMDSEPGLYKNVLVLDFKSLYPSIIRTFKIDPMGLIEGLLDSDVSTGIQN